MHVIGIYTRCCDVFHGVKCPGYRDLNKCQIPAHPGLNSCQMPGGGWALLDLAHTLQARKGKTGSSNFSSRLRRRFRPSCIRPRINRVSREGSQNCAARVLRQCRNVYTVIINLCCRNKINFVTMFSNILILVFAVIIDMTSGNKNNLRTIEVQTAKT